MNKKLRQELKQKKYVKRIQRFAALINIYVTRSGDIIRNPKAIDIINDYGQLHYKNTSTPCSCEMCAGEKYKRHLKKIEDRKLINDGNRK